MVSTISLEKVLLYDKYRLPYTADAVDKLLGYIGEIKVIVDIGAGTGQLARLFANRNVKVYAIEPEPAMRKVAFASLADYTTVEICAGIAEQIPLAEKSIDLIVIGNAFHRFRPEACGELNRILKEKGWIALFSYTFSNKEFIDMLSSKMSALKGVTSRREKTWRRTPLQALFGNSLLCTLSHPQSHRESWSAFFGAACAGIEAPVRNEEDFVQFERLHREVFDTFAVNGEIQIDYEIQVSFGQPLSSGQAGSESTWQEGVREHRLPKNEKKVP
jgi:SAM-dependent methyltransferase